MGQTNPADADDADHRPHDAGPVAESAAPDAGAKAQASAQVTRMLALGGIAAAALLVISLAINLM